VRPKPLHLGFELATTLKPNDRLNRSFIRRQKLTG
jgi:hypothetical protein